MIANIYYPQTHVGKSNSVKYCHVGTVPNMTMESGYLDQVRDLFQQELRNEKEKPSASKLGFFVL